MGCGSCGTGKGGAPGGCKSHGSCSSGGCNRMNVHDWLANLPFSDPESGCKIVEISFNNGSRKDYFKNTTNHFFEKARTAPRPTGLSDLGRAENPAGFKEARFHFQDTGEDVDGIIQIIPIKGGFSFLVHVALRTRNCVQRFFWHGERLNCRFVKFHSNCDTNRQIASVPKGPIACFL